MNDSKEHILVTSLSLFLQKNFKEVTLKEIVDKTGLSKGAFYHYFKSKEQVFEEVINHFYTDLILIDYSKLSQTSLIQFYTGYLNEKKKKVFTSNHYFLIFDAMKMLPDFKKRRIQQQKDEISAWVKVIRNAKKTNEIKSKISDEQLARLFIHSGKGCGISCIMSDNLDNSRKEMKKLWDSLYDQLKK